MAKIVLWGTKDLSQLAHFYLTHDSEHEVVAFTVDAAYLEQDTFEGLPVVPFESLEQHYSPDAVELLFLISPMQMNTVRQQKYEAAKARGYEFISYISSKATYYGTPVGENCFIFENNVVQPFTTIGNSVVLWSGNHIGHHSNIEDHCFITSHAVVSGHVQLGHHSFLGVNSTLRDGITVAPYSLIGAGAFINGDTVSHGVYPGTKATLLKQQTDKWAL